ncbi:MAG: M23 family metallopeptidase [Bacteroidaceae bacterium]|nr:M23 family metallopeptidase [Bacteroidaceae bacterium]
MNSDKKNKESKKQFKSRLLRKYRLTIHNENKLENVLGFYVSPFWVIISLFFSFILVGGVVLLIFIFTPIGEYLPGNISTRTREMLVNYAITIDSLKEEVDKQDKYLANISSIMAGNYETGDTIAKNDTLPNVGNHPITASDIEKEYISDFEEKERYNLTSYATSVGALTGINFYRPTRGMIIERFNPKTRHYGVDIAESPNESVVAIWDGTVILSDYTATDGYVLMIQHNEDLVSIYKNCYRILKNVGDKVIAGEVIGSLSSGDEENSSNAFKPYLHLELWHRGAPLDPGIYISF